MTTPNRSNEELREFFSFLAGSDETIIEVADASLIIFGLENYGIPLSSNAIQKLKNEIEERKSKAEGKISFDDFKTLWHANINNNFNIKEVTANMNQLITEFLENSDVTKEMRNKEEFYVPKLDKDQLMGMMEKLGVFQEISIDSKKKIESDKNELEPESDMNTNMHLKREHVYDMIESLASNGKEVSIHDLEFLISQYLESLK